MAAITYLTTGLELGGAEMQLTALACGFKKRGWRVQVVSMLPIDESVLAQRLERCGVAVGSLEMNPRVPNPLAIWKLSRVVRDFGTHVLHSHMVKANILARLARKSAGVPVQISTAHNTIEGGRWVDWAYRLTDGLADLTTNVSEAAVKRYIEVGASPADRIMLVRNGLDLSPFEEDADLRGEYRRMLGIESAFVWIGVGRLTEQKDYPNMVEAFGKVLSSRRDARLLIVGRGPDEQAIERAISDQGLSRSITLLGERDDVPALLNASDAYVMSSRWEGAPIVLLEAAASRLPVVTTNVGGNAELVIDGETGVIVEAGDSDALGDAMLRIMNFPPEERNAMGLAGLERTKQEFELERILDQWETLYNELLT